MLVANLWAKDLIEDDLIVEAEWIEHYRFGPIKKFTVERSEEAHAAEKARKAAEEREVS